MKALLLILLLTIPIVAQENVDLNVDFNTPNLVRKCFEKHGLASQYEISARINPFYLRGDFNGDDQPDYAVFVTQGSTKKEGVAICHGGSAEVTIIAAGTSFAVEGGYETDDFRTFDMWQVLENKEIRDLTPHGEGIVIGKAESSSGLIYCSKGTYVWRQLGI